MTQNIGDPDVSRILAFEWHATHHESLAKNLPPLPRQISTSSPGQGPIGFSEADWHAITVRAMALRKFYLEDGNAVRIDEVLNAVSRRATRDTDTQTAATELVSRDAKAVAMAPAYRVAPIDGAEEGYAIGERGAIDHEEDKKWHKRFAYGALLHSDEGKAQLLMKDPSLHMQVWAYWSKRLNVEKLVLEVLGLIRHGREKGHLTLPEAWPPIWGGAPTP